MENIKILEYALGWFYLNHPQAYYLRNPFLATLWTEKSCDYENRLTERSSGRVRFLQNWWRFWTLRRVHHRTEPWKLKKLVEVRLAEINSYLIELGFFEHKQTPVQEGEDKSENWTDNEHKIDATKIFHSQPGGAIVIALCLFKRQSGFFPNLSRKPL